MSMLAKAGNKLRKKRRVTLRPLLSIIHKSSAIPMKKDKERQRNCKRDDKGKKERK
jgi:hypothetical protein